MLCISLNHRTVDGCLRAIRSARALAQRMHFRVADLLFEIRADLCGFGPREVEQLMLAVRVMDREKAPAPAPKILMTCRMASSTQTEEVLTTALLHGASYVDLEREAPLSLSDRISQLAHSQGCQYIVSTHDFQGTPSVEVLQESYQRAKARGADLVKIVTTAQTLEEASRVLSLYHRFPAEKSLLAFTMGVETRFTRELCLRLGAPFTYVSLDAEHPIALGQYPLSEMIAHMQSLQCGSCLPKKGFVPQPQIPLSKSMAQRAILASALAGGVSSLRGFGADLSSEAQDVRSALRFVGELGAVSHGAEDNVLEIKGACLNERLSDQFRNAESVWEWKLGESGLLTRLALPLAMFLLWKSENADARIRISGQGTLCSRDFSQELSVLSGWGLKAWMEPEENQEHWRAMVLEKGAVDLSSGSFVIDGSSSSQMVSGFLMMLPLLAEDLKDRVSLTVLHPASLPYIGLTLQVLRSYGIVYGCEELPEASGVRYCLQADETVSEKSGNCGAYVPADLQLEGDWSSAAYILAAWSLSGNPGTLPQLLRQTSQADEAILQVLQLMGLERKAFDFDATDCPDLFPVLAILAGHCKGVSRIRGLHRLYNKESNRALAILSEMSVLGYSVEIQDDALLVEGRTMEIPAAMGSECGGVEKSGSGRFPSSTVMPSSKNLKEKIFLRSYGDHRMAMSLAVEALFRNEDCYLDCPNCVQKSFPAFWKQLR